MTWSAVLSWFRTPVLKYAMAGLLLFSSMAMIVSYIETKALLEVEVEFLKAEQQRLEREALTIKNADNEAALELTAARTEIERLRALAESNNGLEDGPVAPALRHVIDGL